MTLTTYFYDIITHTHMHVCVYIYFQDMFVKLLTDFKDGESDFYDWIFVRQIPLPFALLQTCLLVTIILFILEALKLLESGPVCVYQIDTIDSQQQWWVQNLFYWFFEVLTCAFDLLAGFAWAGTCYCLFSRLFSMVVEGSS